MVNPIASFLLLPPEEKQVLGNLFLGLLNSAPAAAASIALGTFIQWNLELTGVFKDSEGKRRFKRLTIAEIADLENSNMTTLSVPVLTNAFRLADSAIDAAQTAGDAATGVLGAFATGGIAGGLGQLLFGSGGGSVINTTPKTTTGPALNGRG